MKAIRGKRTEMPKIKKEKNLQKKHIEEKTLQDDITYKSSLKIENL